MIYISPLFVFLAALVLVSAGPLRLSKRGVDPALVPQFGVSPGINATPTGDCDGVLNAQDVPVKIPCTCPPDRDSFIDGLNANVAAGHAVNNPGVEVFFPTDNSPQSLLVRLQAATVTLQNLRGPDVGCPVTSTTFNAQIQAIQNSNAPPAAAAAPPPPASSLTAFALVDPTLVPQFGVTPGQNPNDTGDCDGIDTDQGFPIQIPCSCPPDRTTFIQSLSANVALGHAVQDPTFQLSFPTDNSTASQLARIQASIITLQNLNGPGVGCPTSSTTFVAQQQAIQGSP